MGLITTNYISKSTGLSLPVAYAQIRALNVDGDNVTAVFAVQASREAILKYSPVDTVKVMFRWDRKTDPAKMAYEYVKRQVLIDVKYTADGERVVTKKNGILFGWDDDFVTEAENVQPE